MTPVLPNIENYTASTGKNHVSQGLHRLPYDSRNSRILVHS